MMRSPLGHSVLVVILLGLCVCITNPIRAQQASKPTGGSQSAGSDPQAIVPSLVTAFNSIKSDSGAAAGPVAGAVPRGQNVPDVDEKEQVSVSDPSEGEAQVNSETDSDQIESSNSKRDGNSQPEIPFGNPKSPNAAGANQEDGLSAPANQPPQVSNEQQQQQAAADLAKQQQQQQQGDTRQPPDSSQRSFSTIMSAMNLPNINAGNQFAQQPQASFTSVQQPIQQQVQRVQAEVPSDNLPTIIENNQPVNQPQQPQQSQQPQQQQSQQSQQQQQDSSPPALTLPSPDLAAASGNSSLGPSTMRTFGEGWTNCQGGSSGKYGTCKNDVNCKKDKGIPDGSCMSGLGVCCVMALTCNDKSYENNTFFANPDFPEPSWEARLCEVEIKKKHSKIVQIMIEFEEFELAPPNYEGECTTDVFQVKLGSGRPSPYSLLRICGQNTGQHMYLDVSQIDEPLLLSIATSGGGFPRRWSIRIVQLDEKNFLLAPPGCLQYYTDTIGHFRSFNLGQNLRNLYYAICFRIDNGYSGIRFTSNFFGMNGHHCNRKPKLIGHGHGHAGGGHNNYTNFEAHPHHLVIPPPGHALPPPRPQKYFDHPKMLAGPTSYPPTHAPPPPPTYPGRYKRYAYSEPMEQRVQRTFGSGHEHEAKFHEKALKHHEQEHYEPAGYAPSYPPTYGPSHHHGYGGGHSYGPPPHHMYGGGHGYQEDKKEDKFDKFDGGKKDEKWGWASLDKWGWKSEKKEDKYPVGYKHPEHYEHNYGGYGQQHHGGGGGGYGPPPGYGGGYGPAGYGGEYHHKEIDKFGKKYEHLEYKHEKNHLDKEGGKKEDKSWWWWNKKDDKKNKEKFFQHHEALFPMMHIPEMPHCEPRFCGTNDVITFPPSGDSISEMCGNRFNRGHGPKTVSGSPLVVYVSNRGHNRGAGFDLNYEQIFYVPKSY